MSQIFLKSPGDRGESDCRLSLLLAFLFFLSLINVAAVQAEDKQLKIGVLAKRGPEHCLQKWSATADYLSQNIPGYSFSIIPLSFDQVLTATVNSEIDFVLTNSSYYVSLEINHQANRLATLINRDIHDKPMTTFAGVIFTRANRQDINSMQDFVGKSFVAVDPQSLGGWLAVLREFKQAGIEPRKEFKRLSFTGTHDATVYAVRDGQADAGCVRTSTLERMAREGKIDLAEFKVIYAHQTGNNLLHDHHLLHSTVSYPEWPLAKLKHIDEALALKVANALINMPSDSHAARSSYSFGWSVPLNYQSVHEGLRELKVGPYRDYGEFSLADVYRQYWLYILAFAIVMLLFFSLFIRLKRLNVSLQETVEKLDVELDLRQKAEKKLQESSEKIKLFAYSVSHDLKSPAMALHGATKLLAKKYQDRLDDKGVQYCDRIVSISEQINSLTEQINLYMSTREQPIVPELINAKKIFQAIRQEYAGQLGDRGIKWHESGLDVNIRADRLAMFRVFRNFIDNSLKYGGDFLSTIEISYEASEKAHIFSVKDDGVGLDSADCEKVFDPFQRSGTASGSKGSGLGLAIVKEIAELHRGAVWGVPAEEKGITFYFKIAKDL